MRLRINKIGSDCEVFLKDSAGIFRSVEGKLGGTKDSPRQVLGDGFAVQEDNVMPEFNVPPTDDSREWAANIERMITYLRGHFDSQKLSVAVVPSAVFPAEELRSKQAQTFGCDPDYCVWTSSQNPPPEVRDPLLRTAGGHIHVSFTAEDEPEITIEHRMALVKALDLYIGVPSIVVDRDVRRRELYGKAGAFRIKDYGIEYRVPSNFWAQNIEYSRWVFLQVLHATEFLAHRDSEVRLAEIGDQIQSVINTGDFDGALRMTAEHHIALPDSVWMQHHEQIERLDNRPRRTPRVRVLDENTPVGGAGFAGEALAAPPTFEEVGQAVLGTWRR